MPDPYIIFTSTLSTVTASSLSALVTVSIGELLGIAPFYIPSRYKTLVTNSVHKVSDTFLDLGLSDYGRSIPAHRTTRRNHPAAQNGLFESNNAVKCECIRAYSPHEFYA